MFFRTPAIDTYLLNIINQQLKNPLFDFIMPVISNPVFLYALIVPLCIWAWRKKSRKQALLILALLVGVGVADLGTNMIKKSIDRVRPLNALAGINFQEDGVWTKRPADFVQTKERGTSYPSAHSANTMCIALLGMIFWPRLKKWPLLLPLVVGYSRVYLGKHYPLDVLAGWLFGIVAAGSVWLLWRYIVDPLVLRKKTAEN